MGEWKPSQAAIDQWGEECRAFAELMASGVLDRYFFFTPLADTGEAAP